MRSTFLVLVSVILTLGLGADEIFIPIAGSVGVFSTDMRIVNPSPDTDLVIQATYLPRNNVDNSGATSIAVTVPPREMAVFDDVVASLFSAGDLGAIRLVSDQSFKATARIYAQEGDGTLGQFIVGVPLEGAMEKGILLQLKSTPDFRTNIGLVNPDPAAPAEVDLALYDASDMIVATTTITLKPWGVVAPTNVLALFQGVTEDLSDAWVTYEADKPVMVYGSVIDNRTTDPTYVPAVADTGSAKPPEQELTRTIDVTAFQWGYSFRENGAPLNDVVIETGTRVIMRFQSEDVEHGFNMSPYLSVTIQPGSTLTREFVAGEPGTVGFFCTVPSCGAGHTTMAGSLQIVDSSAKTEAAK